MGQKLGQHYLTNKGVLEKIISASTLEKSDTVLEIGPGKGALTFALAERAGRVIAVEKDARLAESLRAELVQRNFSNVEIVTEDIRTFLAKSSELKTTSYSVVANIPYYLTSSLIRTLLEHKHPPKSILLTIQKEVAQRIVAKNGKNSILSLSVQLYADANILFYVARGSFAPPPDVDSAVIRIRPRKKMAPEDSRVFFTILKAGFSAPRKTLRGNLQKKFPRHKKEIAGVLERAGVSENTRPERVTLSQWQNLTNSLKSSML